MKTIEDSLVGTTLIYVLLRKFRYIWIPALLILSATFLLLWQKNPANADEFIISNKDPKVNVSKANNMVHSAGDSISNSLVKG